MRNKKKKSGVDSSLKSMGRPVSAEENEGAMETAILVTHIVLGVNPMVNFEECLESCYLAFCNENGITTDELEKLGNSLLKPTYGQYNTGSIN